MSNILNVNSANTIFFSTKKEKKPDWLKVKLPSGNTYSNLKAVVEKHHLHTICESGNCPNMGECWNVGTATFMILGNICTRSCGFCAVETGRPFNVNPLEPLQVAQSIKQMGVKHCVITSVDRDDLEDGGVAIWLETIEQIRKIAPETTLETLIPDFKGDKSILQKIVNIAPEIVSHNLETVKRLTKKVRIQAKYERSLDVLQFLKDNGLKTKSGIMLGMGETQNEIYETMDDLRNVGVDIFTLGQYLQPSIKHLPVIEYIHPNIFAKYKETGLQKGFIFVESGPLVRSSYHAEKHLF